MALTSMPKVKTGGANPYLLAALGPALSGIMGGFFGGDEGERQERLTEQQLAEQRRQFDLSRQDRGAVTALGATQMNPLAQQESRQNNAIRASLLSRSTRSNVDDPSSGVNWNPSDFAAFFTPEARQNAENAFNANASAASGNQYTAQTGVGYGGAGAPAPGAHVGPATSGPEDWSFEGDLSRQSDTGAGPRASGLGGVLGGAGTGASFGSIIPGIGTGVGALAGGAIGGVAGLIRGKQNDTKQSREALARSLGMGSLEQLNQTLNSYGPEGQRLVDVGLNRIGRKDAAAQVEWERQVQRLMAGRKPAPVAGAAPSAAPPKPAYLQRNSSNPNPTLAQLLRGRQ